MQEQDLVRLLSELPEVRVKRLLTPSLTCMMRN